jgi:ribosomal protein S18 acetylase RimI-like enzyme
MNQKFIQVVQEKCNNAWPAERVYLLNGWILRFNKGVTHRANSVLPLQYWGNDLNGDIHRVEKIYSSTNFPPIFMLHDHYKPSQLKTELKKRQYKEVMPTYVLGIELKDLKLKESLKSLIFQQTDQRTPTWFEALRKLSPWRTYEKMTVIGEIMDRITLPRKKFFYTMKDQGIVGTLFAVSDGEFMALMNLAVDVNVRNQGIATELIRHSALWASANNVRYIYLQVEKSNKAAVQLYLKLGFTKWYSYYYYEKNID